MGFLKIKMVINKYWKALFMFIAITQIICGCGTKKTVYCIDTTGTSHTAGNAAAKNMYGNINKSAGDENIENESIEDESLLYKKVPVYGRNEKKKIKKYLSSLPDEITEEEAKKKGIVMKLYNGNKNNFNTMWNGFYKYVREGEKALKQQDGVIKCYAKPFKAAVVLLRYTTEGDACYTYVSFIEGRYYVMTDNSRDKFMKCTGDGIDEIGTFKSIRRRKEKARIGDKNCYHVIYSVFKKPYISGKEVKKVIKKDNSYASKYYDLFSYYTYGG
ncbi:MAG: hypothetical protein HFH68_06550 [Lachnospiraceae bacterium]|nr:hypothetical protein [Lachnospiraceae bacterium]